MSILDVNVNFNIEKIFEIDKVFEITNQIDINSHISVDDLNEKVDSWGREIVERIEATVNQNTLNDALINVDSALALLQSALSNSDSSDLDNAAAQISIAISSYKLLISSDGPNGYAAGYAAAIATQLAIELREARNSGFNNQRLISLRKKAYEYSKELKEIANQIKESFVANEDDLACIASGRSDCRPELFDQQFVQPIRNSAITVSGFGAEVVTSKAICRVFNNPAQNNGSYWEYVDVLKQGKHTQDLVYILATSNEYYRKFIEDKTTDEIIKLAFENVAGVTITNVRPDQRNSFNQKGFNEWIKDVVNSRQYLRDYTVHGVPRNGRPGCDATITYPI